MSRFQTSEREIAETFLRNLDVELDDTQQRFLEIAIFSIQRNIQLSNDEHVEHPVVRWNFNETGLTEEHLRDLIDHVRRNSIGDNGEIPTDSNSQSSSAGVSSC